MRKKTVASKIRKKFIRFIIGSLSVLSICVSFGAFFVSAHGKSEDNQPLYKYYRSIEIQSGDTLWEIAEKTLTADYDSVPEYVQALKDMNNLDSDYIQAGQNLIIAYNDTVYTE